MLADAPLETDGLASGLTAVAARRRVLAACLGLLAAGCVVVLRAAHLLEGTPAVVVATLLALAVPTGRGLSRRVLMTGALAFGWLPLLWCWRLPVGDLGRATLVLAVLAGGLTTWVASGPAPAERVRRLWPDVRIVDTYPLLAGLVTGVVVQGWLRVRDAVHALALLLPGWDHSAHFGMAFMLRLHGVTTDALPPPPDGSSWAFTNYPQGFHAFAATLVELARPQPGAATTELTAYVHAMAVLFVLLVTLVVAAVTAVPAVRSRPLVAAPFAAFVTAAFTLGPGAEALRNGFPNFVFACALAGAALALAATWRPGRAALQLAALSGALVGVAFSWAPMLTVAAPGVAALLPVRPGTGWRGLRPSSVRRVPWPCVVVLLATVAALVKAWAILSTIEVGTLVTSAGSIAVPAAGPALALALAAAAAPLALLPVLPPRVAPPGADEPESSAGGRRVGLLALGPLCGLATAAALALQQLRGGGPLSYYFWKYLTGLELVSVVVLAVALAQAAGATRPREGRRAAPAVAAVLLVLAASQAFGYAGPSVRELDPVAAPGMLLVTDPARTVPVELAAARRLLHAVTVQQQHPGVRVVYLALMPHDRPDVLNSEQWLRELTASMTTANEDTGMPSDLHAFPSTDKLAAALAVLRHDPDQLVVVDPQVYRSVAFRIPQRAIRARLLTWPG